MSPVKSWVKLSVQHIESHSEGREIATSEMILSKLMQIFVLINM